MNGFIELQPRPPFPPQSPKPAPSSAAWASPPALDGGTLAARSPVTGETLAQLSEHTPQEAAAADRRRSRRLPGLAQGPRPAPGRAGPPAGARSCARYQDGPGRPGHPGGRQGGLEGLGEVQEMIDICDYAVGLSRQLFGLTIATGARRTG